MAAHTFATLADFAVGDTARIIGTSITGTISAKYYQKVELLAGGRVHSIYPAELERVPAPADTGDRVYDKAPGKLPMGSASTYLLLETRLMTLRARINAADVPSADLMTEYAETLTAQARNIKAQQKRNADPR